MLMCNEKITLVKHVKKADQDQYTAVVINGASWFGKVKISPTADGAASATEVTCRIPADKMPDGVVPEVGDYILRGETEEAPTLERLTESGNAFEVLSIGDNRRGNIPHWRLSGV